MAIAHGSFSKRSQAAFTDAGPDSNPTITYADPDTNAERTNAGAHANAMRRPGGASGESRRGDRTPAARGLVAANAAGAAPLWVTSTTTPDTAPMMRSSTTQRQ